jgi:hypothetical protein
MCKSKLNFYVSKFQHNILERLMRTLPFTYKNQQAGCKREL